MSKGLLDYLFALGPAQKRAVIYLVDAALLAMSFAMAMALRLDGFSPILIPESWVAFGLSLPCTILLLDLLGVYRTVVRHVASRTLPVLALGLGLSATLLLTLAYELGLFLPRSVPAIYWLLAIGSLGGVRFGLRGIYRQRQARQKTPIVIYGAGTSGRQLMASLVQGTDYWPIAFLDDAREIQGRDISGYRVHSPERLSKLVAEHGVETVMLAIPSATHAQRAAILTRLEPIGLRVQTVPGIEDIVAGRAKLTELREIPVEDLLGRDLVPPQQHLLEANIRGKAVMVTGAGGSIGSELCRQILRQGPATLVLIDLSEFALYQIDEELQSIAASEALAAAIVPLLGSVLDQPRIESALRRFKVDTIFHAAAYKHVPLVEQNIVEGVRNNVSGTLTVARTAIEMGVSAFVLISTDKAVRPTNIMGASKRVAELICQAMSGIGEGTVFSIVRFGNVVGSSGSVIPLFRRQIEAGGPITVTHPEITRYFMAIPEAAQLVIQAGAMGRGGEVFVLDMGEPVRIVDLATRMARLSGLSPKIVGARGGQETLPDGSIAIRFTELRPGEKLYEELFIDAGATPTSHPRILTATDGALAWPELEEILRRLEAACEAHNLTAIRGILRSAPTGYQPTGDIVDLRWEARRSQPGA
jgi:FlaA1/EpsC-like NDP-sugar epimerase